MRPEGSPGELERRRMRAIGLLAKEYQPYQVAEMVGVDRRSVRRWNRAFRLQGIGALVAVPAPGRPPKLDSKKKKKLLVLLNRGAMRLGYPTNLWTCGRVRDVIASHLHTQYDVSQVWRLLCNFGWSPQKPVRFAAERDEKRIAHWKAHEWPRIKKK